MIKLQNPVSLLKYFSKIKNEGTRRKKYQEGYLSVFLISEKWGGGHKFWTCLLSYQDWSEFWCWHTLSCMQGADICHYIIMLGSKEITNVKTDLRYRWVTLLINIFMLVRYINEHCANVHMIMLHVDIINSIQKYDTIHIDKISTGLFFFFF